MRSLLPHFALTILGALQLLAIVAIALVSGHPVPLSPLTIVAVLPLCWIIGLMTVMLVQSLRLQASIEGRLLGIEESLTDMAVARITNRLR